MSLAGQRYAGVPQGRVGQRTAQVDGDDTRRRIPIVNAERPSLHTVHAPAVPHLTERVDQAFTAFFQRVNVGDTPGELRVRGND
ncbi:MAG: hypothetical protein KatS3mg055_0960 [Chloroflexus sp.]|nr:MAG: hypothetical protein KatS3mg055_0960 [Chloroflexus sp.]